MIKCNRCGNVKKFIEVHLGGRREHEWTQENNGRFIFDGSNYDKVKDTLFICGMCNTDLGSQYRKFLQALFSLYDEQKNDE